MLDRPSYVISRFVGAPLVRTRKPAAVRSTVGTVSICHTVSNTSATTANTGATIWSITNDSLLVVLALSLLLSPLVLVRVLLVTVPTSQYLPFPRLSHVAIHPRAFDVVARGWGSG